MNQDLSQYEFNTPMMKQYLELKKQYNDCLLLFRLGDFYELFLEDAKIGAEVLDITLTKRDRGSDGEIPMAGVPYHAIDSYLSKLVKAGFKVALCEQLSDPSADTKLVERDVVRIVTPGTVLDEKSLDKKENNFIISIHLEKDSFAIAACDISTGKFFTNQFSSKTNIYSNIITEIEKYNPSECVLPEQLYENKDLLKTLKSIKNLSIFKIDYSILNHNHPHVALLDHFNVNTLEGFGIKDIPLAIKSSSVLLCYLKHTQKEKVSHIRSIQRYNNNNYLIMDSSTISNLELFYTLKEKTKKGSLVNLLDQTKTSMGARKLRDWLRKPLTNEKSINKRFDSVAELYNYTKHTNLSNLLSELVDVERLLARISVGISNPRDLISLKESLKITLNVKDKLANCDSYLLKYYSNKISLDLNVLINYIDSRILQEPGIDTKNGNIVKKGVNKELDKLKESISGSKEYLASLEIKEKKKTNISSLKVKYNKVFGYYIEVSKSNVDLVPQDYQRKQTLVNAERYVTEELKQHEEIILNAEETIKEIEFKIFQDTVEKVLNYIEEIQEASDSIAELDCLLSFSIVSQKNNYSRPVFNNKGVVRIVEGRHPVVEKELQDKLFVPNDLSLSKKDSQVIIITGPNMAGKSVYIRQSAIICLLAQIGCYVPAEKANLCIFKKIFVRSGASDFIASGLSTFMVEMVETANILNNADNETLIIMDEVGRGTSTYDGISIAQAVIEFLLNNKKDISPKTLFATHYHELQELEKVYKKVKNYQMAVEDSSGTPTFLHKVIKGGADHSYGINVAELAGIPKEVISRANEILHKLENSSDVATKNSNKSKSDNRIVQDIKNLNISNITPIEALNILFDLQTKYKDE